MPKNIFFFSQYRYRNIGNSLHNTFFFIKRLSVFFIPFSKQNCIIYSGTQLDGTDNKICNIENRITTNIRNSQIAVSMVSTNIIGSMRDFIVNNNTSFIEIVLYSTIHVWQILDNISYSQ